MRQHPKVDQTRRVYQRCKLDHNHSCLQRLIYLKIESLELCRIYLDIAIVHTIIGGLITTHAKQHFSFAIPVPNSAAQTRRHWFKLKITRYRLNIVQNFFFNRVVSNWNRLPEQIVNIEYFLSFKKALRIVSFQSVITFNCQLVPMRQSQTHIIMAGVGQV